jgi:hypothetical protein
MLDADMVFKAINWLALAGWAALLLSPLRRGAAIVFARIMAACLCGLYLSLLVNGMIAGPGMPEGAGFQTLDAVQALLSTRGAILAAWVHFLAFDLFVGSWIASDAPGARVPHALVIPCLALTFVAGPAGLLLYLLLKAARRAR